MCLACTMVMWLQLGCLRSQIRSTGPPCCGAGLAESMQGCLRELGLLHLLASAGSSPPLLFILFLRLGDKLSCPKMATQSYSAAVQRTVGMAAPVTTILCHDATLTELSAVSLSPLNVSGSMCVH